MIGFLPEPNAADTIPIAGQDMHLPTPQSYEAAVLEFFNEDYPRELPTTPEMDRQRFTREVPLNKDEENLSEIAPRGRRT
ncbi:hypothetical protein FE844_032115 (plasmid) [Rhizobium indicum]|uniref:hypothetical protein n=1 Tax=Rhizobium indicum TaxID=2583231 RepID=UPI00156EEB26|nr:hypothetical protein [Rhizobium indicum]QKK33755.1 hypothetical protein FE844_032115 [Rhizobium indicum]